MLNKEALFDALNMIKDKWEFTEIYVEDTLSLNIEVEKATARNPSLVQDQGIGLRCLKDSQIYYCYCTGVTEDALFRLVNNLPDSSKNDQNNGYVFSQQISDFKIDLILEKLKTANEKSLAYNSRIINSLSSYVFFQKEFQVVNSFGNYAENDILLNRLKVEVLGSNGSCTERGVVDLGKNGIIMQELEGEQLMKTVAAACEQSLALLAAQEAPTGYFDVILNNGFGSVLLHEACGHALEADAIFNNNSFLKGQKGQKVADSCVTLIDDGSIPGVWGTINIDDEGYAAEKTYLIREGRLENFMSDVQLAKKMNATITGNGRRQSYAYNPIVRMTNTYLEPSDNQPADIIRDTSFGIYAKSFGGGQVDSLNGDFVFYVTEAYLIEKGRLTTPLKGIILSGNAKEVLVNIDAIGSDLEFDAGLCGKDGQYVPVSGGQPTIRVKELLVGGKSIE